MLLALASAGLAVSACSDAGGGAPESTSSPRASAPASPPASPSPSGPTSPADGAATERGLGPYTGDISPITPAAAQRMRASHHAGCPVSLADLRHLRVSYVDYGGASRTGELVVHREVAEDVVTVFRRLYAARWPVARMRLVDAYGGDDDRSMAANNTSAYNCRQVAGSSSWSEHAYGKAIDVNPVQNPYVQTGSVAPPAGQRYADLDRSPGADVPPGVVRAGDPVVRAFAAIGWEWGGEWTTSKDYQQFSLSGR
jgi:poly-gamma-glutamate synthesis protein (capsule biosynthesis protein)